MRIKTEIPINVGFVKRALGIKQEAKDFTKSIRAVCTDSRKIKSGDLFIGLKGENHDGSLFISDIKKSAQLTVGTKNSGADITLENPNAALLLIAGSYKKLLPIKKTIAITGSVGKTTTKNILSSLLSARFKTHSTYKNLNNEFGVPFTVLAAPAKCEMLVIEAGMNHSGELKNASFCIEPDISVITKIGSAHIGNLGSREKIADAKCEILSGMKNGPALIPYGETLLSSRVKEYKTVSTNDAASDYSLINDEKSGYFVFSTPKERFLLSIPSLKHANFHVKDCLAFALSVCAEIGMTETDVKNALARVDFSEYSKIIRIKEMTIINDSYNSSPDAVISAIDALKTQRGKKSAVLGDMLELGAFSENLHFEIGFHAAKSNLENLYLVGNFTKYIYDGALAGGFDKNKIFINESSEAPEITAAQILLHSPDEVILFKASRKIKLERIIDILKKARK